MKELKITKGEWYVKHGHVYHEEGVVALGGTIRKVDETKREGEPWLAMMERVRPEREAIKKERLENVKFIAEAGNVANETGLTPRELLEQRNELLEALKELCFLNSCEEEGLQSGRPKPADWFNAFRKAESAINKANEKAKELTKE